MLKLARCKAVLEGRDYVTPDDVKAVAVPALAHRLALRPELWVQRIQPEDVVAERLETVPTPRAEDVDSTRQMKRSAAPKLRVYAGLSGLGLLAALVLGQPLLVTLAAPFALVLVAGLILGDDPGLDATVTLDRDRVLEGDEVELSLELEARRGPVAPRRADPAPAGAGESRSGRNPVSLRLEPARAAHRLAATARGALGQRIVARRRLLRGHDTLGLFRFDRTVLRTCELARLPARGASPPAAARRATRSRTRATRSRAGAATGSSSRTSARSPSATR